LSFTNLFWSITMTLRLSAGMRNFINQNGSFRDALQGGEIQIYSGAQPATADAAVTGTLLATITSGSGARTQEVLATGTVTLTGGAAGSINTVTVNSVNIIDTAVPFNTSLTQTASDLAAMINNSDSVPEYNATASGAVVTITSVRGAGAGPNGFAVAATLTTITATYANMSGGVSAVNGLLFGVSAGGILPKRASQTWSGVAVSTNTAGWFRFVGSVGDAGGLDTTESTIRMDGAISTSGAQLNMSSTTITSGATQTIASFPVTLPTS
jgi:hypothetical protein